MSTLNLSGQIVQTLLTNALYSALLFALLAPVVWLLRNRAPQIRHALWTIVLLRLALPPSFRLPFSAGSLLGGVNEAASTALAATFTVGAAISAGTAAPHTGGLVLFSLWMCGTAATGFLLVRSRSRMWALVRRATRVESPAVLEILVVLRNQMGIRRHVEIVTGPGEHGAFTVGTLRPRIYVPDRMLSALSIESISCIIAHELAHVQRLDDLDRQAQAVLQSIYFFNPVVWVTGALRSQENELVCDGLAIRRGHLAPAEYGRCILDVLRLGVDPMPHAPMFFGRKRTMKQRIESVLHARSTSRTLTIFAIAAALFLLPMGGTSLQATLDIPEPPTGDEPIRVEGDVVAPKVITKVEPKYPPEAREERLQGTVIVETTIDGDGTVSKVEVIESTREDFEASAIEAVRQWRFEPATLEGEPVAVIYSLTIRFRLKK